jgi:hypothetical protein
MDIDEQVEYGKTGSAEDLAAAESLLEKGHLRHCLFCTYWALEKMLKALVTQRTRAVPPRVRNLSRLATLARLKLDGDQIDFFCGFGAYQKEGGDPDAHQVEMDRCLAWEELRKAREMLVWLGHQLESMSE